MNDGPLRGNYVQKAVRVHPGEEEHHHQIRLVIVLDITKVSGFRREQIVFCVLNGVQT